jgi:hypothetical protein
MTLLFIDILAQNVLATAVANELGVIEVSMADYRDVSPAHGSSTGEPDLHLIKQVEQVTTLALEGPARRFARVPGIGIPGACRGPLISDLTII